MHGGQEATAPAGSPAIGLAGTGEQHHEGGQVLTIAADAVAEPGTETRPAGYLEAGAQIDLGGAVVELRGVHRLDERHVVGDALQPGEQTGNRRAGISVAFEGVWRRQKFGHAFDESETLALDEAVGDGLSVVFLELRFVVEEVNLRRAAGHVQIDHALGFCRKVEAVIGGCQRVYLGLEMVLEDG
jgi:hypothetical protein